MAQTQFVVADNPPNLVALLPITEITEAEATAPTESKETICFYCKLPLSQCSNQNHWNKKLETENLSPDRAMAPKGSKNFVLVSSVPGDKSLERIEADQIQKEIGYVAPSGQNPDPEDSNLTSTLDFHWVEQNVWGPVERLEEQRIHHYIEKCPDIETALRWHATFPPYLRDLLLAEWLAKRPSILRAVEQFLASSQISEYKTETLTLNCSRCGVPAELTLTFYGNALIIKTPQYSCPDCLGRLTDFTPRSRLRKYPRCRRQRIKKAA